MEAIQSLLQNGGVVMAIAFLWGLACKRLPWLKAVPNVTIPYVNTILLFLTTLIPSPETSPAIPAMFVAKGMAWGLMTTFGNLIVSAFQSAALALVYDKLVKPIEKGGQPA